MGTTVEEVELAILGVGVEEADDVVECFDFDDIAAAVVVVEEEEEDNGVGETGSKA